MPPVMALGKTEQVQSALMRNWTASFVNTLDGQVTLSELARPLAANWPRGFRKWKMTMASKVQEQTSLAPNSLLRVIATTSLLDRI
jgi:hypothetical protein